MDYTEAKQKLAEQTAAGIKQLQAQRDSFLAAVDRRKAEAADHYAEERTRIGNTPDRDTDDDWTCAECGEELNAGAEEDDTLCIDCKAKRNRYEANSGR